ncbi:hypothetical protein ScPMuIL_000755 [Solemya velum]
MAEDQRITRIKNLVGGFPDFPKPGILFRDIFPVLRNPGAFKELINVVVEHVQKTAPDVEIIVGLDSRGFIFGPMVAHALGIGFVPVRKSGKLPGETISVAYSLEYGKDRFEMQKDSLKADQKVIIIDDLIATGGTMAAACELVGLLKANIVQCFVVIELEDLNGKSKLSAPFKSLIKYSNSDQTI